MAITSEQAGKILVNAIQMSISESDRENKSTVESNAREIVQAMDYLDSMINTGNKDDKRDRELKGYRWLEKERNKPKWVIEGHWDEIDMWCVLEYARDEKHSLFIIEMFKKRAPKVEFRVCYTENGNEKYFTYNGGVLNES